MQLNSLQRITARHGDSILLALIILLGLLLRCYHLGYQSLWGDEIHTAIESDPALRDHSLLYYLRYVEQQPPLFFLLERVSIWLFGNNEASLRLVPALAGTCSIWAIYLLGKELKNSKLGLYAALLMAVNYFGLYYSQDARPYTLVLFFSILSWVLLLKFLKSVNLRNCLLYAAITLVMLHSNYFGLFVLVAQVILTGIVLWVDEPQKKKFFRLWALAGLVIAVCFAPLLPLLQNVTQINTFWAPKPAESVGIDYFFEYFGSSDLLKPFLLLLLISFFAHLVIGQKDDRTGIRDRPLVMTFAVCSIWIFTGFFIPFIRSWLVVPMMVLRYTTTIVPAFILLLAAGLEVIASGAVKAVLLCMFCLLSFTHIVIVTKYYHDPKKTQFRELAAFMSPDTAFMFPVLTENTAFHQPYYLRRYRYRGRVIPTALRQPQIDSILHSVLNNASRRRGFWLTGAHHDPVPDQQVYASLDSAYIKLKEIQLLDAWGQLFIARDYWGAGSLFIDSKNFPESNRFTDQGRDMIAAWDSRPVTLTLDLKAGAYKCLVVANGSPAGGIYPHMRCSVNGQEIGASDLGKNMEINAYDFVLRSDTVAALSFMFDNDAQNPARHEDRNMFIHKIIIAHEN